MSRCNNKSDKVVVVGRVDPLCHATLAFPFKFKPLKSTRKAKVPLDEKIKPIVIKMGEDEGNFFEELSFKE